MIFKKNIADHEYECDIWSKQKHPLLDLFGINYVPLRADTDPIWRSHVDKLARLVIDSGNEYKLMGGEKITLGAGYALEAKQIDIDGKKIQLEFTKDGQYVDDMFVPTDSGDQTWNCTRSIQGVNDVLVLRVHVNQIFQGAEASIAKIDGIWLIDYTNVLTFKIKDKVRELTLKDIIGGTDDANLGSLVFEANAIENILEFKIVGKVTSNHNARVNNLMVEVVDVSAGNDTRVIVGTTTDNYGEYSVTFKFDPIQQYGKKQLDLQARAFIGETFLGASDVHYNASDRETLNIQMLQEANSALPSEHETLTDRLFANFNGKLRDLKETDDQPDITILANKTGWDARAVAMAALADQFSARAMDGNGIPNIEPSFFYALFRAGLPANENVLYHTNVKTLEVTWKKAAEQGVIPEASINLIPNVIEKFQALSAQKLLTGPALVGVSPLNEMLKVSGLDDEQQQNFTQIYTANRDNITAFWKAAIDAFPKVVNRLLVDGKLGHLTINNAPLMQKVHTKAGGNGISNLLELAKTGYHQPRPWKELLTADVPIPNEIPGDKETKRENYAEFLAAQVRLCYPTASVAQMIDNGDLPLTGVSDSVSKEVYSFLSSHQGKFEIGVQPVQQYIAQNSLQVTDEIVKQVERLQRVYQITPSDQALIGLMRRGIDSAYNAVRYDKETFIQSFAEDLGGADHAALTYEKSMQVHNAVLNITLSYLTARTAPAIGVHSPAGILDPTPTNAGDVIAYATLENLFGSMDFCECDHCRSILSPAAYLVDLLLFLDQPNPPAGKFNPQRVLLERRPDIEYLPLTCENTNTALPYIDIVNEALEYFIANDSQKFSLQDYCGYDTNGVASEDLLASPQFVRDSAYMTLKKEYFPLPLPFHQSLENLRRYFNKFEVPLPLAMERLRKTEDLERGANPFGWRDILMEEIGLSRDEYEILANSTPMPLWQIYGFSKGKTDTDVIVGLSNVKQFARRVGITYENLVSILKTRFVNPNSFLIPKLERLGIDFSMLSELKKKNDPQTDAKFDALISTLAVPPDPAEYGGNIKEWVKNDANYAHIMGLITLAINANTWINGRTYDIGACVWPTVAPGTTLYYECTTEGTPAGPEPKWPTTPGDTYKDGTVIWTCRDASSCFSFKDLAFRYSDPAKFGQNINAVEFIRMLRFIRLWKKLGWTIEQTDAAICALYRKDLMPLDESDINDVTKLNTGFLTLLPRLGIVIRVMKALNLTVKSDLLQLLACWSEIGTHDNTALYRHMFINQAILKQDPIFADNGYGQFLQHVEVLYIHTLPTLEQPILDAASGKMSYNNSTKQLSYSGVMDVSTRETLKAVSGATQQFKDAVVALYNAQRLATHAEALRSAFNLTGNEYDNIVNDLRYDTDTPLTIPNISAIFRRGWLARKLKLSVNELLLLTRLTGLDPFTAPDPINPAIFHLIKLVQAMNDRSFKSSTALYLIWNQDLSGKSAPGLQYLTELVRTLRSDFASIDDQFAAIGEPQDDIARSRMILVYGQETSDAFFALLDDTLTVDTTYTHPAPTLESAIIAADARISYDNFSHRLSHKGLMTIQMQTDLKNVNGASEYFKNAVDMLFARSEEIKGLFFTRYPELEAPYKIAIAKQPAERHNAFIDLFQPDLVRRRKQQQALQRLSIEAGVDLTFTQATLNPSNGSYPLHATGNKDKPALNDVLALENSGLAAQFFYRDKATGPIDLTITSVANLDYASGSNNPLPNAGNVISGIWSGQIEAPEIGFYNFIIRTDIGAAVTLNIEGKDFKLIQNGNIWRNIDAIEFKAGILYEITLKVEKVKDSLSFKWETPKRAREVIPSRYLYSSSLIEPFYVTFVRFLKTASLAVNLGLTANELAHFAIKLDYQINADGWLNALSVESDPASDTASALLKPFEALLAFARIKEEVSPGDESLLAVLKDPVKEIQNKENPLFTIARWNQTSLNEVLSQFSSSVAGLGNFDLFYHVYGIFEFIKKMGISAKALISVTTNEPTNDHVRDLQAALRARYAAADWRAIIRPINDEMRSLQRDALVAYILHQMRSHTESAHIDTPDKLFEYFLMDVQMAPCMQTSRIRHALSSVQLFIERCLMNLEPRVCLTANMAKQWKWMKRYRIWEANRKVYLFPENWLEPELRDDKSPFFKEFESELLQSDINEERAAIALMNYLFKLGEVAKLEPCGIYHIPADQSNRKGEINHIIARTSGLNRKYYYRRYEYGYWTPWEHIKLDIEDNPVIPVIWKDRLLLFWLQILKDSLGLGSIQPSECPTKKEELDTKTKLSLAEMPLNCIKTSVQHDAETNTQMNVKAVLCWSEFYNGKWQDMKTSDVNNPVSLGLFPPFNFERVRSKMRLWPDELQDSKLRITIYGPEVTRQSFLLYNTHSLPQPCIPPGFIELSRREFSIDYGLSESSESTLAIYDLDRSFLSKELVLKSIDRSTKIHDSDNKTSWDSPFFLEDSQNVFYVTSKKEPIWVPDFKGYGTLVNPIDMGVAQIPTLVTQLSPQPRPKPWGDGGPFSSGTGFIDSAPMQRYVTEDAYIRQGIGSTVFVKYGDTQIGPSGTVKNILIRR